MRLHSRLALAAGIALATLGTAASAQTLGELLSTGHMSELAFQQLIAGSELTASEARGLTLEDVIAVKWQDD
jgi:ABC-type proline/glycine betaine transport system permease subunit